MRKSTPSLFFLILLVSSAMVHAQEPDARLAKVRIDHAKGLIEPAYKSPPVYCLLVFGKDLKRKVWLVLDGYELLYADLNGDKDFEDKGERIEISKSVDGLDPTTASFSSFKTDGLLAEAQSHFTLRVPNLNFEPSTDEEKETFDKERQNRTKSGLLFVSMEFAHQITFSPKKVEAQVSWVDGPLIATTDQELSGKEQTAVRIHAKNRRAVAGIGVLVGTYGLPTKTADRPCFFPRLNSPTDGFPVAMFKFDHDVTTTPLSLGPKKTLWTGKVDFPKSHKSEYITVTVNFDDMKELEIQQRKFKVRVDERWLD